jgi:RNA polymerase sigma-70 factor, ECF subfamily
MLNLEDRELILQLQAHSLEALGQLYDRHQRLVYRTALAITGDDEAAADLLQDVFLRLYRFADHIDVERPLEPWLYRVTTNLAYTWIKRSRRWLHSLEDLFDHLHDIGRPGPPEEAERNDERETVRRALASLPVTQRVVVVLYYMNELSITEIAEILEIPAGTVKSRLHYGRIALKKKLGVHEDGLLDLNYERS